MSGTGKVGGRKRIAGIEWPDGKRPGEFSPVAQE
jgi:hypothetical protein